MAAPRVLLALLAVRAARGYDWCYADEPDACDGDPLGFNSTLNSAAGRV